MKTLPNFLYIGPPKSASSWLYELFLRHPQVFVPPAKDIYYFDRHYDKGEEWYGSFFTGATPRHTAIGELSHDYLYSEVAAQRIHRDLEGVKLLVTLRNPIDRAISHFRYSAQFGNVPDDFFRAIEINPLIIEFGRYSRYLRPYVERFGPDRLKISLFDDLRRDAQGFSADILRFLGVDPHVDFDFSSKVNAAATPRNALLTHLTRNVAGRLRAFGAADLVGRIKRSKHVRNALFKPTPKYDVPEHIRGYLIETYDDELRSLRRLLNRDLPTWTTLSSDRSVGTLSNTR